MTSSPTTRPSGAGIGKKVVFTKDGPRLAPQDIVKKPSLERKPSMMDLKASTVIKPNPPPRKAVSSFALPPPAPPVETPLPPTQPSTPVPESSEDCAVCPPKPKKRKRTPPTPSPYDPKICKCLVLKNVDNDGLERLLDVMLSEVSEMQEEESGDASMQDIDIVEVPMAEVRFLLSDEQKRENKTRYREEYGKRPEVIEKRRQKESDPDTKAKRDSYQKQPNVQKQKKIRTQVRQKVLRRLKKEDPEKYKEFEIEVLQTLVGDDEDVKEPSAKRQKKDSAMDVEVA